MYSITIPNAECVIDIDGQEYTFQQVTRIETNDPRTVTLLASPQNNSDGLVLRQGLTQAAILNTIVREVPFQLKELLIKCFEKSKRVTFSVLDTDNGGFISAKKALISSHPANQTIDENESVFDVQLNLVVTPNNLKNTHKDVS